MAKILPILLMLLGLAGGAGAGFMLRPDPPEAVEEADAKAPPQAEAAPSAIYDLDGQFLVPLVEDGRVVSLVVVELALQVDEMAQDSVAAKEPLLRDRLLQILFDHANVGGFDGLFTSNNNMTLLRRVLLEEAGQVMQEGVVQEVLITNILRNGA
jgi:flagellar basal body-associated protein FliL